MTIRTLFECLLSISVVETISMYLPTITILGFTVGTGTMMLATFLLIRLAVFLIKQVCRLVNKKRKDRQQKLKQEIKQEIINEIKKGA